MGKRVSGRLDTTACVYARPLTTDEAAAWANVSRRKLLDYARAGILGKKVGHKWYFSQNQLARIFGVENDIIGLRQ